MQNACTVSQMILHLYQQIKGGGNSINTAKNKMSKKRIYVPLDDETLKSLKEIAKVQKRSPVSVAADYIEEAVEVINNRKGK